MGPILIFDKSALQSFGIDESVWLDNYFLTNITPLFYVETLADLSLPNPPKPAEKKTIEQLLFCGVPEKQLQTARVLKHVEKINTENLPPDVPRYDVCHPFFSDGSHEPWLDVIEVLHNVRARTVLSINLEQFLPLIKQYPDYSLNILLKHFFILSS